MEVWQAYEKYKVAGTGVKLEISEPQTDHRGYLGLFKILPPMVFLHRHCLSSLPRLRESLR